MHIRKMRRFISILLIAVILAAGCVPTAFASVSAKVNTSSAKAYSSASTKSAYISVSKNTKVSVTDISGGWAKVSAKGVTAYMPLKYLTPTKKVKGYTKDSTTVYNTSGKKMGKVSKGTGMYVLGTIGKYYCVMNGSGTIGYVKKGTLSDSKPAVSNVKKTAKVSKVDKAILVGRALLGRPYKTDDNPPNSFDCSSFVQYCLKKAGISIKKTSATQAADSRHKLITSVSDLKRGDVLCFDTSGDGNVDHSAIYLGGNKFIEASRNAGKVQINTLTSWYKGCFVCARRPS